MLIIGILSAIAVPSWVAFTNRQRINVANDAVLRALQSAQREAKRTKLRYSVSFKVENQLPKSITYQAEPTGSTPNSSDPRWISLGDTLKSGQVLLYTNIGEANKVGEITLADNSNPKTITFDYTGALPLGTDTPLKIIVAEAKPGNSPAPNAMKRCVIVETLIGGMRTAKDTDCN